MYTTCLEIFLHLLCLDKLFIMPIPYDSNIADFVHRWEALLCLNVHYRLYNIMLLTCLTDEMPHYSYMCSTDSTYIVNYWLASLMRCLIMPICSVQIIHCNTVDLQMRWQHPLTTLWCGPAMQGGLVLANPLLLEAASNRACPAQQPLHWECTRHCSTYCSSFPLPLLHSILSTHNSHS